MPVKGQQRAQTDSTRTRDRANTNRVDTSKTVATPTKSNVNQLEVDSDINQINSRLSNLNIPEKTHRTKLTNPLKIITEVDETNIDEVLKSPDLSKIPKSFLTEIEQDQVYETILQELQKKLPRHSPPKSEEIEQKPKSFDVSPAIESDDLSDNDENLVDEISSSSSSEINLVKTEEDYDTDIETEVAVGEDHDPTGITQYRGFCKRNNVIPCSYFIAHIQDREMILRYHQFSNEDIRLISKSLCSNLCIERLLLDGNYLQQQSAKYISEMILTNDFITELSLADNCLGGGEGTKEICKMLTLNRNLKKINLSGNKFSEIDVTQLIEAFEQNKILRELDLSHNNFGEKCGKALGTFISANDSLESIDLSWNNIRGRGAVDVAHGIKENVRLKRCNLEMNGFGPDGGQILADCIKQNGALEELNINGNRLNTTNAFSIAQALLSNESLQVLKIADNQINSDGALAIFLCIKGNESSILREIDFSHTVVTQESLGICQDIVKLRNGKFQYRTGKATPQILKPNSISECYIKTNEELLNKLRLNATKIKLPES